MKLSELRIELDKAQGWAGGGDPDVVVDDSAIVFVKVAGGRISIEVEDPDQIKKLEVLQDEIEQAEGEADSALSSARDKLDDVSDAIEALITSETPNEAAELLRTIVDELGGLQYDL